ncbi:signal peptidase I [Zhihengliuella sp.]|uniref:signal peptidase I n=1 Tax=Zhihengliuella sp. TaxID=1954483 RepID=UPI002810A38A|nr:signal peptidase I [Zhihengliuella sp.]
MAEENPDGRVGETAEGRTGAATRTGRRQWPVWLSFVVNLLIALVVVALVQAFVVKIFTVPSGSMEPTLNVGDRIVANRLPYPETTPERGDVVVFAADGVWEREVPEPGPLMSAAQWFGDLTGIGPSSEHYLVKRVIGVPGDTVECCDDGGRLLVNGEAQEEPYRGNTYPFEPGLLDCATENRSQRCFGPLTVGEGELLVMGDHRSNSADSVIGCRTALVPAEGDAAAGQDCFRPVETNDVVGKVVQKLIPWGRDGL